MSEGDFDNFWGEKVLISSNGKLVVWDSRGTPK